MGVLCEWNPDVYGGLRELLWGDADAYGYFYGLPAQTREALRRRNGVGTFAELQSAAADEREESGPA